MSFLLAAMKKVQKLYSRSRIYLPRRLRGVQIESPEVRRTFRSRSSNGARGHTL